MLNNLALRLYSEIAVIVLKTMLFLQNSIAFHYNSVYWLMKSISKPSCSTDIEELISGNLYSTKSSESAVVYYRSLKDFSLLLA